MVRTTRVTVTMRDVDRLKCVQGVIGGQLLRTVYLCDYFTLPDFRRSVYHVLERGESVHALQRQICTQALPPKRGGRAEELVATSGALTVVTN